MSSITKFTGYAAAVLASLAVALAVLVAGPAEEAAAGPVAIEISDTEISAAGYVDITVTDNDLATITAGQVGFAVFTINPASIGSAWFDSGEGQSLICINNDDSCDRGDAADNTIKVRVEAQGDTGVVLVDVQLVDTDADGTSGEDAGQVAWMQTDPPTRLTAGVTTKLSAAADGGTAATLLIEVLNAKDVRVSGTEVTVVTTVGSINSTLESINGAPESRRCVLDDPAAVDPVVTALTAGSGAVCHFTSFGDGAGPTTLSLYGTGAETAGQVIINAPALPKLETLTIPFVLTGAPDSVTATVDRKIIGGYADSTQMKSKITVKVLDANGNVVGGAVAAAVKEPPENRVTPVTDEPLIFEANAMTELGDHVIELSIDGKTATVTITVVGKPAAVSITAPKSIEPLAAAAVLVSVRDADDRPVPAGTKVDIAATGDGAIISDAHLTVGDSGDVSVTVIAADKDTGGLIAIFALVEGVEAAHAVVAVGAVVEPDPAPVDAFETAIAAAGQTFTSYSGGTVPELMAALADTTATSATAALADGSTVTVIVGAPAFVNADFNAAFSNGVPARTVLAVRSFLN